MNKKSLFSLLVLSLSFSWSFMAQEFVANDYGLVPFKENNKWGYKKNDKVSIPANYEYVTHFSETFALVKSNGKWGYIDTLGNWHIPAVYDKGQPIQGGVAFVQKEKHIGLINAQTTNFILEPIYTNIKEDYNSYYVYDGDKVGFFSKENLLESSFQVIPAKYDSIYNQYGLISALNEDKTWDIYADGKLVYEKSSTNITYENYNYTYGWIKLKKEDKVGVFSLNSGWIVEPKYAWIEQLAFPYYALNGRDYESIFALHEIDKRNWDQGYDANGEYMDVPPTDSILLAKMDGSLISTLKFNSIDQVFDTYSEYQSPYAIQVKRDENLYNLYADFKFQKLNYSYLIPHLYNSWYIADGANMKYILDAKYAIIDSFPEIKIYEEVTYNPEGYYDENGEYYYSDDQTQKTPIQEPFLIVSKYTNQDEEQAIYQLEERKLISPWIKITNSELVVNRLQLNQNIIYSYNTGDGTYGFYTKGMDKGTEMKYSGRDLTVSNSCFLVTLTKKAEGMEIEEYTQELYTSENGKIKLLSNEYEIIPSADFISPIGNYDYETQDYITTEGRTFSFDFFVLKDKNKQFGLVTFNGKMIKPQFDSITQNSTGDYFVKTMMIDSVGYVRYGNVDLYSGKEVKVRSLEDLSFVNDLYINNQTFSYVMIFDEERGYLKENQSYEPYDYVALDGRKFKCKPDLLYAKKVKGKYGLFGYSMLSDKITTVFEQVSPRYKMLEPSFIPGVYCAKSKKNKWGLINFIGDTVMPLKYSSFEVYNYNGDNYFLLSTTLNKKKGLFDTHKGEIIPCKFDEILDFQLGDYSSYLFLTRSKDKYGLYDDSGVEIVPAIMDQVDMLYTDNRAYIACTRNNKKSVLLLDFYNRIPKMDVTKLKEYDFIVNAEGYIIKDKNYDIYTLYDNSFVKTIAKDDLVLNGVMYNIVVKNGKFGAVDLSGNELIACEYDYATFLDGRDEVMVGYQNGVKYYIYVETKERYTESQW